MRRERTIENKTAKLKICRKGLNLLLCGCKIKNLALQSRKNGGILSYDGLGNIFDFLPRKSGGYDYRCRFGGGGYRRRRNAYRVEYFTREKSKKSGENGNRTIKRRKILIK